MAEYSGKKLDKVMKHVMLKSILENKQGAHEVS